MCLTCLTASWKLCFILQKAYLKVWNVSWEWSVSIFYMHHLFQCCLCLLCSKPQEIKPATISAFQLDKLKNNQPHHTLPVNNMSISIQRMRIAVRHVCFIFWRTLVKQIDKSCNQFCGDSNVLVKCVSFSTNTRYPFQESSPFMADMKFALKKLTYEEFSLEIPVEFKHRCGIYMRYDSDSVSACCCHLLPQLQGEVER